MPGRVLSVRAGLIVGPYDPTGRFTYWVHRAARGGDLVAPEPRSQLVQFVHARDLADWILDMAERREGGVFNATGPAEPLTMERFLEECAAATGSDARFVWVDEAFLADRGVEAWSDLPLWLPRRRTPTTPTSSPWTSPRRLRPGCASVRFARRCGRRCRTLSRRRTRASRPAGRRRFSRHGKHGRLRLAAVHARFSALPTGPPRSSTARASKSSPDSASSRRWPRTARVERQPRRAVRDERAPARTSCGSRTRLRRSSSRCSSAEVVFGANMTTLNFALSRALGRELRGDEIVGRGSTTMPTSRRGLSWPATATSLFASSTSPRRTAPSTSPSSSWSTRRSARVSSPSRGPRTPSAPSRTSSASRR